MICHLPSSQLSPGPIYYCCRLPLCGRKHAHTHRHTHTNAKYCSMDIVLEQTRTHTLFFPISHSFKLKATYLRHSLLSCPLRHRTQQKWVLNSSNFPPAACRLLGSKDIPFAALKIRCYTSHVLRFPLSGTWLTSLCGICLSLHASCFSLCQTSSSWT